MLVSCTPARYTTNRPLRACVRAYREEEVGARCRSHRAYRRPHALETSRLCPHHSGVARNRQCSARSAHSSSRLPQRAASGAAMLGGITHPQRRTHQGHSAGTIATRAGPSPALPKTEARAPKRPARAEKAMPARGGIEQRARATAPTRRSEERGGSRTVARLRLRSRSLSCCRAVVCVSVCRRVRVCDSCVSVSVYCWRD